jgi:hypothetical protein
MSLQMDNVVSIFESLDRWSLGYMERGRKSETSNKARQRLLRSKASGRVKSVNQPERGV